MKWLCGWLTLKNLKIGQKLAVVGLPFLLPIGLLSWIVMQRSAADAATARRELSGVEYARPLRAFLDDVGRHRALAARTLGGAGSAPASWKRRRRRRTLTRPRWTDSTRRLAPICTRPRNGRRFARTGPP